MWKHHVLGGGDNSSRDGMLCACFISCYTACYVVSGSVREPREFPPQIWSAGCCWWPKHTTATLWVQLYCLSVMLSHSASLILPCVLFRIVQTISSTRTTLERYVPNIFPAYYYYYYFIPFVNFKSPAYYQTTSFVIELKFPCGQDVNYYHTTVHCGATTIK